VKAPPVKTLTEPLARHLGRRDAPVRITAKTEYGVRAVVQLAAEGGRGLVKAEVIARAQGIPMKFLLNILGELRQADVVESRRGADGGYRLARPPRTSPWPT